MQVKDLSKADSRVLAQVFDPESALEKAEVLVDACLPEDSHIVNSETLAALKIREKTAIRIIEEFEMKSPGSGDKDVAYRGSLAILDQLIEEYPQYASARNNRAQIRRWRFGDRNTLCQKKTDFDLERRNAGFAAVKDLQHSLALASPERPQDAVSPAQGRLLAQSFTQLAALFYAAFKDLDSPSVMDVASLDSKVWSRDRFEDEASRLFYLGGLYGNEVAKALAVHTNPHAKLCGSIVKEAMRKEMAGVEC